MADWHVHTLVVRDHKISCCDPAFVQHGMGHDAISLDLDAEWSGLAIRLVLGSGDFAAELLYEGGECEVPASLLEDVGWLPVSVVGYGDDGTARVTTRACDHLLKVVPSGQVDGSEPIPDAPDLLGQLVEAADGANEAAEAAREAAALIPTDGTAGQVLTRTETGAKWADPTGGPGGTGDYETLANKPTINGVTVLGDAPSLETYGAGSIPTSTIDSICV